MNEDLPREQWQFTGRRTFYGYDFWVWELVANPRPLHKVGQIHMDLAA
jgi:hypothetical protein